MFCPPKESGHQETWYQPSLPEIFRFQQPKSLTLRKSWNRNSFFFIHPEILQACPQQFWSSNFVRKSTQFCRYQMSRIKIWNTTVCGGTRILCRGNSDSVLLMSWILAMSTHQKAWWFIQCVNRMSLGNETTVHDNISNWRVVSGQF